MGLAAVLLGGCADPGGLKVSGPAQSPSAPAGPVYVSEGPGRPPLTRPAAFAPSDAVRLSDLRWSSWGGATAEATGEVRGTWCGDACADRPYRARVTLGGLVRPGGRGRGHYGYGRDASAPDRGPQDRSAYYGRATVDVDGAPAGARRELRGLRLHVPER